MIEQNQALHTLLGVEIPSIGVYALVGLVAFCTALMRVPFFFHYAAGFRDQPRLRHDCGGDVDRYRCCRGSVGSLRAVVLSSCLRGNRR